MNLQERVTGALLGLACGDALGAPAEFKSQAAVRERWGTLCDMVGSSSWAPGEWTDDTGMALCVAEGIIAAPEDPIAAIGDLYLQWMRTAKDIGNTISGTLGRYQKGSGAAGWFEAARANPAASIGRAASNGSLMRTLPVAVAYADEAFMLRQAARISSMTHWDPQAQTCCMLYCLWVRSLLAGAAATPAWSAALERTQQLAEQEGEVAESVGMHPLPDNFWARLEGAPDLAYEALQPSGYAGYVVECLEAAVWGVLRTNSLEDCLVRIVNLAGEADTMAAVAGGAAGALYGYEAIPSRWLEKLHQRARLEHISSELFKLRCRK